MNLSDIEALIVAATPAITAIVSIIVLAVKIFKNFSDFKKEFKENTDYKELRDQLNSSIEENRKLKKVMAKQIEELSKVKYEDQSDVRSDKDLQI